MEDETLRDNDNDLLPERVSVPSFCCIRSCDREATRIIMNPTIPEPGGTLELIGLCQIHDNGQGVT